MRTKLSLTPKKSPKSRRSARKNRIQNQQQQNPLKAPKRNRRNGLNKKLHNAIQSNHIESIIIGEEIFIKFVLKLLGEEETSEIIDGFVEEWEYFQDLDLIVLGSTPDEYKEYTDLLREEYSTMDIEIYSSMRSKEFPSTSNPRRQSPQKLSPRQTRRNRQRISKRLRNQPSPPPQLNTTEDDCVIVEPLNNTVIYIDCDESVDTTIVPTSSQSITVDSYQSPTASSTVEPPSPPSPPRITDYKNTLINEILKTVENQTVATQDPHKLDEELPGISRLGTDRNGLRNDNAAIKEVQIVDDDDITIISPKKTPSIPILFKIDNTPGPGKNKVPKYDVWSPKFMATPLHSNSLIELLDNDFSDISSVENFTMCTNNNDDTLNNSRQSNNDSIICLGEVKTTPTRNLARQRLTERNKRLGKGVQNKTIKKPSPPKKGKRNSNLSKSIVQLQSSIGVNFYNPNKHVAKPGEKRMVIIDGSNVACGHSNSRVFSAEGLDIAIRFFERKGHETKGVVPQFRMKAKETTNQSIMMRLQKENKILLTPSKSLPGKMSSSYDDRIILQLADEFDAAIISNDNYRDLVSETPKFRQIIENRVIGYTWMKDMFIVPEDPYGRRGPTLNQILNRT